LSSYLLSLDAAAAYAYRDHAQLQLIGKHFESGTNVINFIFLTHLT